MSRLPVPTGIVVVYNAGGSGERSEIESIGRPGFALAEVLSAGTHIYTVAPEVADCILALKAKCVLLSASLKQADGFAGLLRELLILDEAGDVCALGGRDAETTIEFDKLAERITEALTAASAL